MLLILINWIFIFITCLGTGSLLLSGLVKISGAVRQSTPLELTLVCGLFATTFMALLINFVLPVDSLIRYFLFGLSCLILFLNRMEIFTILRDYFHRIASWTLLTRVLFLMIFLIALVKSAG